MNCQRCSAPLPRYRARYCSQRCKGLAHGDTVRLPRQVCLYPPCQREYAPQRRSQKFCSRPCADRGMVHVMPSPNGRRPYTTSDVMLSILKSNRDWYMTVSDLALWVYGDDTRDDCNAVRNALHRVRQRGYAIESRAAVWADRVSRRVLAFRLTAVAQERKKGIAA